MKVVHVPCGPPVNESERKAIAQIEARLRSKPGSGEWLLLTNLSFSATRNRQSDEIDFVAIGSLGVKHWTEVWVKRKLDLVEMEAERVARKAQKIGTTLRKHLESLPRVDGVFLVSQSASKVAAIEEFGPVRGIPFHTLKLCEDAVGFYAEKALAREDIMKLARVLEPKSAVAADGNLKRMANYGHLVLWTPRDQRFRRIYNATHSSLKERVKLHLYDLSASDDPNAEQRAEREWKSLNKLYEFKWVPRIVDSLSRTRLDTRARSNSSPQLIMRLSASRNSLATRMGYRRSDPLRARCGECVAGLHESNDDAKASCFTGT